MFENRADWVLPKVLERQARERRDQPFVQFQDGDAETYGQSYETSLSVANGLQKQMGVRKGDPIVLMAPTSLSFLHCWFGINLLGAVEVPLNPALKQNSLEHALNNSRARVAILEEAFLERLAEVEANLHFLETVVVLPAQNLSSAFELPALHKLAVVSFERIKKEPPAPIQVEMAPKDPASIIYTSGTTGPAKGVVMPHGQIYLLAKNAVDGVYLTEQDTYYSFLPLFHMAGKFMAVYAVMLAGGKIVLDQRFQAEAWISRVRQYHATVAGGHGPFLQMIYSQPPLPDDGDNPLRAIFSAPFPAKIAQEFERRFQVKGIEVWGMTEINCPCYHPYDEPLRVGSCGKVLDDWYEMRIVDPETDEEVEVGSPGELIVRSKYPWTVSLGYFGMPEATVEAWQNLWFHSGDIGYQDKDGYVYFLDRLKERIRRRAENIASYEIEAAVLSHPLVEACAAVGVPSDFEFDDDIKIYVVLKAGADVTPESLLRYLVEKLPHYMVPRYIQYMDELPRTPTNKIQKTALQKQSAEGIVWDRQAAGISVRAISREQQSKA